MTFILQNLAGSPITAKPAAGATCDTKSVPEKGINMKRADITNIFPEATDEQITQLLNMNGTEIANAKNGLTELQTQLTNANNEIARLKDGPTAEKLQAEIYRANNLQRELDGVRQQNTIREIREKVAGEKKIPVKLLTAETEEACAQQADAILAFANPGSYPTVQDGGEPGGGKPDGKDAAWASLAAQISKA